LGDAATKVKGFFSSGKAKVGSKLAAAGASAAGAAGANAALASSV
jgi:hypothetical protein